MRLTIRTMQVAAIAAGFSLGACATARAAVAGVGGAGLGFEASATGGGSASHPQGYLGVDIRDVGDSQMAALKLKESRGAEVIHVDHDGPAGKAELREQDVILQMNGILI